MAAPVILPSFAKGEITPEAWGRVDVAAIHVGAATMRNLFVSYRGGAVSRPGTKFVGRCKQIGSAAHPRLIPFSFSTTQGYILEFGDNYLRFIFAGAYLVDLINGITGVTQANPAIMSYSGTAFAPGDWVAISGVQGMTELDNLTFIIGNGAGTQLNDLDNNPVDSTMFAAYVAGGTASRILEISTPYLGQDLPFLKYTQSADVMTLTHPDYPPFDLRRITNTNWTLTQTDFTARISPPTNPAAVTSTSGSVAYSYVVTAVDKDTGSESVASAAASTASMDISTTAGSITISWDSVTNADSYNIYRATPVFGGGSPPVGSLFSYSGTALGNQFVDTNITPDATRSPPTHQNPFAVSPIVAIDMTNQGSSYTNCTVTVPSSAGTGFIGTVILVGDQVAGALIQTRGENYLDTDVPVFAGDGSGAAGTLVVGPSDGTFPGCAAYFQQRRFYAATLNRPDTYFASKPGDFTNFDTSLPVQDDDAIIGTPWAQQVNGIQFMVPLVNGFVMYNGLGIWVLSGGATQTAVTPADQTVTPQAYHGSSPIVPPIAINNSMLYVQDKGSIARELQYNPFFNVIAGSVDITVLSSHLFSDHQILEWAWAEEPYKLVWAVRDDGTMLSLTWVKDQEVVGWARHDTQGLFKSVAVISEGLGNMPVTGSPPIPATPSGFTVGAVHFDGATALACPALTASDSGDLSWSFWTRLANLVDGAGYDLTDFGDDGAGNNFGQEQWQTDSPATAWNYVTGWSVDNGATFLNFSNKAFPSSVPANTWVNVKVSIRTDFSAGNKISQLFIGDVDVTSDILDTASAFLLPFNGKSLEMGSFAGAPSLIADMAEYWWAPGVFIDWSIEANRRKFIDASGKPVDLGSDGSTPTGTAPGVYLHATAASPAATFPINLGSAGAFSVTAGMLTAASTSPSD